MEGRSLAGRDGAWGAKLLGGLRYLLSQTARKALARGV